MTLANFSIKNWYHAVLAIGLIAVVGGAAFDLRNIDGKVAVVFGLGLMAIGFGEWMNHPFQSRIIASPVGPLKGYGTPRSNCLSGLLLVVIGLVLSGWAGWRFALTL